LGRFCGCAQVNAAESVLIASRSRASWICTVTCAGVALKTLAVEIASISKFPEAVILAKLARIIDQYGAYESGIYAAHAAS
jgi:predicted ATPase